MPRESPVDPPLATRAKLYLCLAYKELQYWLIGLTPEHYHLYQAQMYRELNRFEATIKHYRAYLKLSDDPRVRLDLGMLLGTLSNWSEALVEYERALVKLQHPVAKLAIGEAHLRLGNTAEAGRILRLVNVDECGPDDALRVAKDELLAEIDGAA